MLFKVNSAISGTYLHEKRIPAQVLTLCQKVSVLITALETAEPPRTLLLMLRQEENDYESVSGAGDLGEKCRLRKGCGGVCLLPKDFLWRSCHFLQYRSAE